jgi:pimeloyl-ACP methyl ester carboxylesterase
MAKVTMEDSALYYRELGTGSPLLLIHGTGASADVFDGALPLFAERHRVIVYDRRGYSRSGSKVAPVQGYLKRQVEDAAALLQRLAATPATVVGWSMGGIIGLGLALEYPQLVSRLVMWEPPLHVIKHMPLSNLVPMIKALLFSAVGQKQKAVATFLRMTLALRDGSNGYDNLDQATRENMLLNAETLLHELKTGTGEELTVERVRQLRCPASAIVGGDSMALFAEAVDRLAMILPCMRVIHAPGNNHLSLMTQPADFARVVLRA